MTKTCRECNTEKEESLFVTNRNTCKECANTKRRQLRNADETKKAEINKKRRESKKEEKSLKIPTGTKACAKCRVEKEMHLFVRNGRENTCKECHNELKRSKYANNTEMREKTNERQRERNKSITLQAKQLQEIDTDDVKKCKYCNQERNIKMFRPKRAKCLECERSDGRDYRKSDTGKEKSKTWVNENQEHMTKLQANWYQIHKSEINKANIDKYANNPSYKYYKKSKDKIRAAIKSTTEYDIDILDCKSGLYKNWIEYCLKYIDKDLELDDHGIIYHVDHVLPVNLFNFDDETEKSLCFNWRNTSPMSGSENLSKHDTIVKEQLEQHIKNLKAFHKQNNMKLPKEYKKLCAKHLTMTGNPLEPEATITK